ncbi:DNA-directed RNA polymerase subunit beta' [Candidatus Falkowbacteria bacterium RBG_13_39_14]|uniref:DNA-directed RNA polymerase subunit beta' n=1 Tax=Candidatus Falkowbacteria bacterium RBG_13_39_14 TaxID=1797985 RepID=A0A1F5S5L1_9BACT|nr:MAG: DNA-directed RNA polymerase subunit beta' [Candidatus Falkowbacteria bacterium RBG_13_39_14]
MNDTLKTFDFEGIKLKVASPEQIKEWGRGEVLKPETVNYRTQKPEKDGLFCERIFGPSKDWECYCGKYKKIKYKGIVCDKCGVEVTRSSVRRERMGYISLAAPVSHIWFLRGVPSKVGLILDLSPMSLEKVIYFAGFIITKVDEKMKEDTIEQIKAEFASKRKEIKAEYKKRKEEAENNKELHPEEKERQLRAIEDEEENAYAQLDERLKEAYLELNELKKYKVISESSYQDLAFKYGHIFEANIGAEAIRELLEEVDLKKMEKDLEKELLTAKGNKQEKLIKRLKLVKNLIKNEIRPEWFILTAVPVIPPDLRPMVPLDGGRFATSDLNDLYRRIINRNNRLKQLIELNAPEVICRNEKRMLQEAVDALIDNSARQGKTVVASTGQKRMLKSLADMLKGKQGRFRQNLLGKRIDYSGRSVIVVGSKLKLHQCGLPKTMALELFKPFIISQLIKREIVHNVRSANRYIEAGFAEVWDILEEIIEGAFVFLNRAPTLHRLGIQAFKPILIEGKALHVHPMVCSAFNADFDGDQMAVHVPLTDGARWEAEHIMLSSNNLLKPATGDPVAQPNQDIVWGIFYMTVLMKDGKWVIEKENETDAADKKKSVKYFSDFKEAVTAYNLGIIKLQEEIGAKYQDKIIYTTAGRILFNEILPDEIEFLNKTMDKKSLGQIVTRTINLSSKKRAVKLLDDLKDMGFRYLTLSGLSWGMSDAPYVEDKKELIQDVDKEVEEVYNQYEMGLLTYNERHSKIIELWSGAKDKIVVMSRKKLAESFSDKQNPIYSMIESKARGTWQQLIQIIGMKGLVTNPAGRIIELPVKGNFKEGVDVLEYFISTHGARKGLSDTALRTANAGYLTRRLVDVAQDVLITEEDCGDKEGVEITKKESEEMGETLADRIWGRVIIETIKDSGGNTIAKSGDLIDEAKKERIKTIDLEKVKIRSSLTCKCLKGMCRKCYGYDLGYNELVKLGTAVGIIAAQSIGEPGTQLTMRTFHTGGVVGADITQGLPRVEELFEVRPPKRKAFVAEASGSISIIDAQKSIEDEEGNVKFQGLPGQKLIRISYEGDVEEQYDFDGKREKMDIKVKEEDKVGAGDVLFVNSKGKKITAKNKGTVKIGGKGIIVSVKSKLEKEYLVPKGYVLYVKDGDTVEIGDQLTEGSLDLQQLYKLKGKLATQKYIIREIQHVYSSQGQPLNDKHIEIIGRQLFSKVLIKDAGDSLCLPGEVMDITEVENINEELEKSGKKPCKYEKLLLGITKVSLSTKSFLSAASFQETSRVLINAAVSGKIDYLEGLKENVIIGRLIPTGTGFKKGSAPKCK